MKALWVAASVLCASLYLTASMADDRDPQPQAESPGAPAAPPPVAASGTVAAAASGTVVAAAPGAVAAAAPGTVAAAAPGAVAAATPGTVAAAAPGAVAAAAPGAAPAGAPIQQVTAAPAAQMPGAPEPAKFTTEAHWDTAGYNNQEIVYTILINSQDSRIIHCSTVIQGFYLEKGQKVSISDRQNSTIFPGQQGKAGNWLGMDKDSGATFKVTCHPR